MAKKHWIYIKRGLSEDPKHRAAMGECIWLYMHIIDRADWETGIAYDWKDREESADMGMAFETLRDQRQKLERLDYIRCTQKQRGQDIAIMEWRNPREYGSEVKNPRIQGDATPPPSEFQGDAHGDAQGSSQPTTPTSDSESESLYIYNFQNMTVIEARKVPTLKMYAKATDFFPGSVIWESVHKCILENNLTYDQIHNAAVAWAGRGFKPENVAGILEWAINGIPSKIQKTYQKRNSAQSKQEANTAALQAMQFDDEGNLLNVKS